MSRAVAIPPPRPRPDLGDHAVLVRQPDRLALIAFAEGLQNGEVKNIVVDCMNVFETVSSVNSVKCVPHEYLKLHEFVNLT